jgi:hypothetical protein
MLLTAWKSYEYCENACSQASISRSKESTQQPPA